MNKREIKLTKAELKDVLEVCWMGRLWALSLIDAGVPNGNRDLKQANKVLLALRKIKDQVDHQP